MSFRLQNPRQVYLEEKNVDKALEALRKTLLFPGTEEGTPKKVTPWKRACSIVVPSPLRHSSGVPDGASQAVVAPAPAEMKTARRRRIGKAAFKRIPWRNLHQAGTSGQGPFRLPGYLAGPAERAARENSNG